MTEPLKISVKGSPLSCGEYDENIDRLLDRGNHTGLQSCNTLSDLEECVAELGIILSILRRLGLVEGRIEGLELRIEDLDDIESDLTKLKNDLLNLIAALRRDVDSIFLALTNVRNLIKSVQEQLGAIQIQLETFITDTTKSLADIYRRLAQIDRTLQQHAGRINTLFAGLSAETSNRISADNNLLNLFNREVADRIASVNKLQNSLNVEAQSRAKADDELIKRLAQEYRWREDGDFYILNLLNATAPKDSPIFSGAQANFTNGAITVTPSDSAVKDVINAEWYHRNTNRHLANLRGLIDEKAPKKDPVFGGNLVSEGRIYAKNGIELNTPTNKNASNEAVNASWCWYHFNNINGYINTKADIANPTFQGNVTATGNFYGGGAFVNNVDPTNNVNVPNMGYLHSKLDEIRGVIPAQQQQTFNSARIVAFGRISRLPVNTVAESVGSGNLAINMVGNFIQKYNIDAVEVTGSGSGRVKFWFNSIILDVFNYDSYTFLFYNHGDVNGGLSTYTNRIYKIGNINGNLRENTLEFEWGGLHGSTYASLIILKT